MTSITRQPRPRRTRSIGAISNRVLAAAGLAALLGGMLVVVKQSTDSSDQPVAAPARSAQAPVRKPVVKPAPKPVKIVVTGVGAYDPEGDRSENADEAGLATDRIASTAWESEHYRSTFRKSGVGLVLDAGKPVRASRLVLSTATPGYDAQIQVGGSVEGPFTSVSGSKTTTGRTVFALKPRRARYLVVWVTSMPADGVAAVNEVAVTARR